MGGGENQYQLQQTQRPISTVGTQRKEEENGKEKMVENDLVFLF